MTDREAMIWNRDVTVSIRQTSRWVWYIDARIGISRIVSGRFALGEKRAIKKAKKWRRKLELGEQRFAARYELENP